ncbi:DUF1931 family protein, partial [Streptomyces decoyicus]
MRRRAPEVSGILELGIARRWADSRRCGVVTEGEEAKGMTVMGVSRFERFFRAAASLDVDKNDLKRYSDFVDGKLYDLLLVAQAAAKANDRDIVEPWDLPIT